jgi:hypothetical protein
MTGAYHAVLGNHFTSGSPGSAGDAVLSVEGVEQQEEWEEIAHIGGVWLIKHLKPTVHKLTLVFNTFKKPHLGDIFVAKIVGFDDYQNGVAVAF